MNGGVRSRWNEADIQANKQTNRQTSKQAHRQKSKHMNMNMSGTGSRAQEPNNESATLLKRELINHSLTIRD